jgi:hypothetical protein
METKENGLSGTREKVELQAELADPKAHQALQNGNALGDAALRDPDVGLSEEERARIVR